MQARSGDTLRSLTREDHPGLLLAISLGGFSMATHFGLLWLVTGGGFLGAAVVVVLCTLVFVGIGAWLESAFLSPDITWRP